MAIADQVAANIKKARLAKGWSVEKLAQKLSVPGETPVHLSTVARLEGGKRGLTLDWVERLAEALGVDPIKLISGESKADGCAQFTLGEQVANEVARFQADIMSDCTGDESIAIARLAAFQRELFALVARHPVAASNTTVARPVLELLARQQLR